MPICSRAAAGAAGIGMASLLLQPLAYAGSYDALCSGVRCTIVMDGKGFTGPAGFIPSHRIAQWYTGGGEEVNGAASAAGATGGAIGGALIGGIATCWTIILCPFGLIGGGVAGGMGGSRAGRSADFYFTVIGYNQNGEKVMQSFNFLNKKPVSRMMQELPLISGLGMGEMRSVDQIKAGDTRMNEQGTGRSQLPDKIDAAPSTSGSSKTLPDNLNGTPAQGAPTSNASSQSRCWSAYLSQNPSMKQWAEANPAAAKNLQSKYDQC